MDLSSNGINCALVICALHSHLALHVIGGRKGYKEREGTRRLSLLRKSKLELQFIATPATAKETNLYEPLTLGGWYGCTKL